MFEIMGMPWFRLYSEAVDDEKLRLLAFEDRWHFIAILCLKSQGTLDSGSPHLDRRVGLKLGLQLPQLEEVKRRLMELDLIQSDWQPTSWEKRQYQSDSSKIRTRKWRDRHNAVTVTDKNRTEQIRTEQKSVRRQEPPSWADDFKSIYPPRAGDPNWRGAWRAANARIAEGHSPEEFLAGARRYAEFCMVTGKANTETVQQASRFLGPSKPFLLPWNPPATKAQQAQDANVTAAQEWLRQSGVS